MVLVKAGWQKICKEKFFQMKENNYCYVGKSKGFNNVGFNMV